MVSDTRVLTCIMELNACHDESVRSFDLFCVFIDDGVRVCVRGLGGGNPFKFSVSLRASKLSSRAFLSRRSSLTVESCVELEVAHLSVLMVRRLR